MPSIKKKNGRVSSKKAAFVYKRIVLLFIWKFKNSWFAPKHDHKTLLKKHVTSSHPCNVQGAKQEHPTSQQPRNHGRTANHKQQTSQTSPTSNINLPDLHSNPFPTFTHPLAHSTNSFTRTARLVRTFHNEHQLKDAICQSFMRDLFYFWRDRFYYCRICKVLHLNLHCIWVNGMYLVFLYWGHF